MIYLATGDEARRYGADIILSLTPAEAEAIGAEAAQLGDWLDTVLWALALLRTGRTDSGAATTRDWATVISHLSHRLEPRLSGILSAAMRAHEASGGSVGDMALAMDVARSTAQYRREVLRESAGDVWEAWARGELAS